MIRRTGFLSLLLPLALAACGGSDESADATSNANAVDPALASALQGQIMVDPQLSQQSNGQAVRPASGAYSAGVPSDNAAGTSAAANDGPLMKTPAPTTADKGCTACSAARESATLGGLAARQADKRTSGCAANLQYSAGWAQRLPRDLPLHPQARVTEAAGTETGECALRVVSFSLPVGMQGTLDWYYTRAVRAGYTAEHQVDGDEHILGGTRDRDGGAYVLYLSSRADGGTDVDLVANNGI
ncbi:hypothetical protein [Sphingomonas sp.]|uniref:hypothetical protein n=1 Tax=Sphingomonas sp. TaxID=28214 RepID=UPI001B2694F7|nr:hypothetical protein [Sphingomonas sp.]MBO9714480.1 hypothetical protein [Sphingomonas sp.]